jgi:lipopolysaccharide biosynthesis regulator YciM
MSPWLWQWFSDPSNHKILLSIAASLILGFIIGRLTKQVKSNRSKRSMRVMDKAFLKGVQYILSNDHDRAIEEFTKSVRIDSDTIETYVALGDLYRSKGNIDRAIRIRQSIILRPNIDEQIKLRALIDLGLDYRKGGLFNRALETFAKVLQRNPAELESLHAVERIYEEMKDWENAFATRQKIARLTKGDHAHILAHYQTEMGKTFREKGDMSKAKTCFEKALSFHDGCVDARLHLGDLLFEKREYRKAIAALKKVVSIAPPFTFLAYRRLERAYASMEDLKPVEQFLKECAESNADAFTHMALGRYLCNQKKFAEALAEVDNAVALYPSFWEARRLKGEILLGQGMREEVLKAYQDLIAHLNVPYLNFQCKNCGFRPSDLQWQCPQCKQWDTIELMDSGATSTRAGRIESGGGAIPAPADEKGGERG